MPYGRFLLAGLIMAMPTTSLATRAIVPDQYTTIQAALNSGVDTVLVRAGTYPEALTASRSGQSLVALPGSNYSGPVLGLPSVTSLTSTASAFTVDGFNFEGPVFLGGGVIQRCWLRAGLNLVGNYSSRAWNNIVFGDLIASPAAEHNVAMNTVIAGSLVCDAPGTSGVYRNAVLGPAAIGIRVSSDVIAGGNYVRGCVDGIHFATEYSGASGNVIEDCSGSGIVGNSVYEWCLASDNTVRRCGGDGLHVSTTRTSPFQFEMSRNVVDSTGGTGIYARMTSLSVSNNIVRSARGKGMDVVATEQALVTNNTVSRSASDGMVVSSPNLAVSGNVVGHSGGRGLVGSGENVTVHANTSYLNTGAGLEIGTSTAAGSAPVDHNIGYGSNVGLRWLGPGNATLSCNDWYANMTSPTQGISPGATDRALNPLFCNPSFDDVSLSAISALLNVSGCGLIGALGQGCTYPAAVEPSPTFESSGLAVFPRPGAREIRLSWKGSMVPTELAIYDAAGARRWSTRIDAGRSAFIWRGEDDQGRRLPPGVYFARLSSAEGEFKARVVLVR